MDRVRRGEIRWYRFNKPDKRRPVLILTRDSHMEYLNDVTVAPITSTLRDNPSQVMLTPEDGMPRDCAVNLDGIRTVSKSKIGDMVASLGTMKMFEVRRALLYALGFSRHS